MTVCICSRSPADSCGICCVLCCGKNLSRATPSFTRSRQRSVFGMQNFHFQNITSFFDVTREEIARLQKPRTIATSCQDVILEYFQEHEWLDHWLDGRITVTP